MSKVLQSINVHISIKKGKIRLPLNHIINIILLLI